MWWPAWLRKKPEPLGKRGEALAARHLRRAGYRILDRNVRLRGYEIDLVAQDGDTIAFVEVKTRRVTGNIAPEDSVGPIKQDHLRRAAHAYADQLDRPGQYYRFDVVSVVLPDSGRPQITLFKDAFQ